MYVHVCDQACACVSLCDQVALLDSLAWDVARAAGAEAYGGLGERGEGGLGEKGEGVAGAAATVNRCGFVSVKPAVAAAAADRVKAGAGSAGQQASLNTSSRAVAAGWQKQHHSSPAPPPTIRPSS